MNWMIGPLLITVGALMIGYGLGKSDAQNCGKPVSQSEWRQAPHEQQPEPMMAQAQGDVERWVM